jgi:hypothetical protein
MCSSFQLEREEECGQTKKRRTWCATTSNQEKKYVVCNNFQLGKEEKCGE